MVTHSSVLAWRIPGMRESGGLPSMGSHRVGHDRSDLAAAAATYLSKGFPPGSAGKEFTSMQETQETAVRCPGLEDPLGEGLTTYSSILVWRVPWTEEPGGLQSGLQSRTRLSR